MAITQESTMLQIGTGLANRRYHLYTNIGDGAFAAPGDSITLNFDWATTGAPTFAQADLVTIEVRAPSGTAIAGASTWTPNLAGADNGSLSRTFHFDSDPLNEVAGTPRWGMVEIVITVRRNAAVAWGPVDSRGVGTPPAGNTIQTADQGWWRALGRLSTFSYSNASLGGAAPPNNRFAYPYSMFFRAVFTAESYESGGVTVRVLENNATTRRSRSSSTSSATRDFSFSAVTDRVDTTTPAHAAYGIDLVMDVGAQFGTEPKLLFHSSGQPAGWTVTTEGSISGARLNRSAMFAIDPTVTQTLISTPNPVTRVHNRGEQIAGIVVDVKNANSEGFAPRATETFQSVSAANAAEETMAVTAHDHTTGRHTLTQTFATTGNSAPATLAGEEKKIRWRDSQANSPQPTDVGPYGLLSSLYQVAIHLQVNNNLLDPALHQAFRLTSDLGFYSVKVTNVRGEAVNGASGVLSLQDDASLTPAVVSASLTTASVNGHDGYVPFQTWDKTLPTGAWDLWASTSFTKDGNTGTLARGGTGTFNLSLRGRKANYLPFAAAGPAAQADEGDHWHPGDPLLVGYGIYDTNTETLASLDASPAPTVRVGRFNDAFGRIEYLKADLTWEFLVSPNTAYAWPLAQSAGDPRIWVRLFSAAETADFDTSDLFYVGVGYAEGTPYPTGQFVGVVSGAANAHDGYSFDFGIFK